MVSDDDAQIDRPDLELNEHCLRDHVGLSEGDLRRRLANEGLNRASTFPDRETAAAAIDEALVRASDDIQAWLAETDAPPLTVVAALGWTTGVAVSKHTPNPVPAYGVKAYLSRSRPVGATGS